MKSALRRIVVRAKPRVGTGAATRGVLVVGARVVPVALGRGGIKANKFEGDGGTPRGRFRLVRLWWRGDRMARPRTALPVRAIRQDDGWCEDPRDRNYNRRVPVPKGSHADRLARKDVLYDLIVELDHNTRPRIAKRGSAVFIHIARSGFLPTAGCVALAFPEMRRLVERIGPRTVIDIR